MSAIFSPCGQYRYRLERDGPGDGSTAIIMVNPSTADADKDDATIRKLRGFGERNGWGRLIVGNLFAYRATDVRELVHVSDPVGPENAYHLGIMIGQVGRIIVAWGPITKQPKAFRGIWTVPFMRSLRPMSGIVPHSIGEPAKCGHPKHPLMLPYDSPILPWSAL